MNLVIENISKTYPGGVKALDDITLTIPPGMFGLLGPNGAGKSTLMRTIATLQKPDSGSIMLGDIDVIDDPVRLRRHLGYLPQEFGVYSRMSAWELLDHLALMKGLKNRSSRREMVASMLRLTNLHQFRNKPLGSFSGGMKQRFGIAQALIGSPKLLIVDEPTAGLDPEERNRFLNILSEIGEETIVILSTHIVNDVSELCSAMAVIHHGRLLYSGRPQDAMEPLEGKLWRKTVSRDELMEYRDRYSVISSTRFAGRIRIHVLSDTIPGDEFEAVTPDLRDVYFQIVNGRPLATVR